MRLPKPDTKAKLKPYKFPEGMVLVVDTREQAPLFKKLPKGLILTRDTLTHGDYSIRGFEEMFMIERKQISDLIPYLLKDHLKTRQKLDRCRDFLFKALVIEATEADILSPQLWSQATPEQIRQAMVGLELRYNMHIYYSKSRADIERWILDRCIKFYKIMREEGGFTS